MARFEAVVFNGKSGKPETLYMENTYALGGRYCYEDTAKNYFENGDPIAMVVDHENGKVFWLANINW